MACLKIHIRSKGCIALWGGRANVGRCFGGSPEKMQTGHHASSTSTAVTKPKQGAQKRES